MEKRLSSEERLRKKLKESEVAVDRSKFEQHSPEFDPNDTELGENDTERNDRTDVSFQSSPDESGDEEEQPARQPEAELAEPTPLSRRGRPFKQAKAQKLFRSTERISSRTRSRSPQSAECASSAGEVPVQTLSLEPTQCCIQVLTATVKPQLSDLVDELRNRVAVKSNKFREAVMSGRNSGRKKNGREEKRSGAGSHTGRLSRSVSRENEERARWEERDEKLTRELDAKRDQAQRESNEAERKKRADKKKAKDQAEKERVQKQVVEAGFGLPPKVKRRAESKGAESATSGESSGKKAAKPKSAASVSSSGSSVSGSEAAMAAADTWKSSAEVTNYLQQVHVTLYPSGKARDLKERILTLGRSFHAREKLQTNSYLQKRELTSQQRGYSRKKKRLHHQRMQEDLTAISPVDLMALQAEDEDAYDMEAEKEVELVEHALLKEKESQAERKKAHRQATEKWENRTVVSQNQQAAKFKQLAEQLTASEKNSWKDQWRGRDRRQQECTRERLQHYFVDKKAIMQREHPLYSVRKQSQYQRFSQESVSGRFEDWESTDEYDTNIDEEVAQLTSNLEERVAQVRELEAEQLSGDMTAQIVEC